MELSVVGGEKGKEKLHVFIMILNYHNKVRWAEATHENRAGAAKGVNAGLASRRMKQREGEPRRITQLLIQLDCATVDPLLPQCQQIKKSQKVSTVSRLKREKKNDPKMTLPLSQSLNQKKKQE